MNKKLLITFIMMLIVFIFTLTFGFALIFTKRSKTTTEIYQKPRFVTRDYTYHKKTFPAPYKEVGNLPKQ